MDSTSKPDTDWAKEALRTFWRRTFTQLANAAQKDSQAYRAVLKGLA